MKDIMLNRLFGDVTLLSEEELDALFYAVCPQGIPEKLRSEMENIIQTSPSKPTERNSTGSEEKA